MSAPKIGLALLTLGLSGCFQSYLLPESDWKASRTSSTSAVKVIRESDGQSLLVRPDSIRIDTAGRPAPPAGQVRVRSARARKLWPTAAIMTSVGGVLAIAGPILALTNFCLDFDHSCSPNPTRDSLFTAGVGIGVTGDIILTLGTILFGEAAYIESRAEELAPAP